MTFKEVVATALVVFVYVNNVWGHGNIFVKIPFLKNLLGYSYGNNSGTFQGMLISKKICSLLLINQVN